MRPCLPLLLAALCACAPDERARPPAPPPPPAEPLPDLPAELAPFSTEQPHVVLVIGCTVRRDQLAPYGGRADVTPHLARLAAGGARFADAFTAAPWTKSAHTALLTGRYASSIGMVEPGEGRNSRRLADAVTTLGEHLGAAGYTTLGLTANPNLNAVFGFAQGFSDYYEATDLWREVGTLKVPGQTVVGEALRRIDAAPRDRPVYVRMTLVDAHDPFDPASDESEALRQPHEPAKLGRYRVGLRRFDAAVGALVAGLEARGLTAENTVFMVVNDHGEGLNWPNAVHGKGHGNDLLPTTTGMPWIATGPGLARNHTVAGLASQIDVLPTVLGLVGAPVPDGPGHDWSAQLRGEVARTTRSEVFIETWMRRLERAAIATDDHLCVQQYHDPRADRDDRDLPWPRCYQRRPDHTFRTHQPAAPALLAQLESWHQAQRAALDAYPHAADATFDGGDDDGVWSQLEALGYVGD